MDKITCPALIVHRDADADEPPEQGRYAAGAIKEAELYLVEKGSHVAFWMAEGADAVQEHAIGWLREKIG